MPRGPCGDDIGAGGGGPPLDGARADITVLAEYNLSKYLESLQEK